MHKLYICTVFCGICDITHIFWFVFWFYDHKYSHSQTKYNFLQAFFSLFIQIIFITIKKHRIFKTTLPEMTAPLLSQGCKIYHIPISDKNLTLTNRISSSEYTLPNSCIADSTSSFSLSLK